MNFNKTTRKAVKVEKPTVLPRPIVISNASDKGTLIAGANLPQAAQTKAYEFFKINGERLPIGKDFGSYLKDKLGDIHYEKVGATASIRLNQEKRIEFTQSDTAGLATGDPMQIIIYVTNVGSPTYSH